MTSIERFGREFTSGCNVHSVNVFNSITQKRRQLSDSLSIFMRLRRTSPFAVFSVQRTLRSLYNYGISLLHLQGKLHSLLLGEVRRSKVCVWEKGCKWIDSGVEIY